MRPLSYSRGLRNRKTYANEWLWFLRILLFFLIYEF